MKIRFTHYIGDSTTFRIPLTSGGIPFTPPDGMALISTGKTSISDSDENSKYQKTTGAGITIDGTDALVTLLRADTVNLQPQRLTCDVVGIDPVKGKTTLAFFYLNLAQGITRELETSIPVITTEEPLPYAPPGYQISGISVNADQKLVITIDGQSYLLPMVPITG